MTAEQPDRPDAQQDLLFITGMSGAGKGTAAKVLEEFGWYVVDNVPTDLLGSLVERITARLDEFPRFAFVADVRSHDFENSAAHLMSTLLQRPDMRVLFLDATDEELVKRFNHVRRSHPLQGGEGLIDDIGRERVLLEEFRGRADVFVDTSSLSVHDLRRRLETPFGDINFDFHLTVESFGFKYGVPLDIDMLFDMRFLPNPHWVPELRSHTGRSEEVRQYVMADPSVPEYLDAAVTMVGLAKQGYRTEGKRYLTIAVGCTGGKHRSVAVTEQLAERFREFENVDVHVLHRDLGRE